jgi:hypothetical protein
MPKIVSINTLVFDETPRIMALDDEGNVWDGAWFLREATQADVDAHKTDPDGGPLDVGDDVEDFKWVAKLPPLPEK